MERLNEFLDNQTNVSRLKINNKLSWICFIYYLYNTNLYIDYRDLNISNNLLNYYSNLSYDSLIENIILNLREKTFNGGYAISTWLNLNEAQKERGENCTFFKILFKDLIFIILEDNYLNGFHLDDFSIYIEYNNFRAIINVIKEIEKNKSLDEIINELYI